MESKTKAVPYDTSFPLETEVERERFWISVLMLAAPICVCVARWAAIGCFC